MTTPILLYEKTGRIARITLNRPEKLNAINDALPRELRDAVTRANSDEAVHVIVLSGAGRAFCAGYDLEMYAEKRRPVAYSQDMPWDPMVDYAGMSANTACFMSLWRSFKPVICKVQGYAVAGGSDIALCADMSSWPRTRGSAIRRRASGAARPPRCGSTAWAPSAPSGCS